MPPCLHPPALCRWTMLTPDSSIFAPHNKFKLRSTSPPVGGLSPHWRAGHQSKSQPNSSYFTLWLEVSTCHFIDRVPSGLGWSTPVRPATFLVKFLTEQVHRCPRYNWDKGRSTFITSDSGNSVLISVFDRIFKEIGVKETVRWWRHQVREPH